MFKLAKNSLAFEGGHSDELSFQTCKILLDQPEHFKAMEIIYADEAVFSQTCIFVLGGAHYRDITLNGVTIEQNTVYAANENDVLRFIHLEQGFRLYLIASAYEQRQIGRNRREFTHCFAPAPEKIRLIKGPEYDYLADPETFLASSFVISANSDLGGLRLETATKGVAKIQARQFDITSSIVDDGLIQLTANGPIVLLRERQVTGGYPRIFSVIKTDLDFLAQYKIGSVVHFELIKLSTAKALLQQREQELLSL
ncbi:hypothetical protein [sulfur-oxidizing endosymbiont of Gigantopelta aegis]|uniref:hypothetical protein n=1 Tax=sulfur-oxidizing endosymbiont of Gigantopelta aegis TaxID=2794934 RepID=UPI0018DD314B|nr:hypothetical protein [sulfur-oxidizing endosymbiont of Gigantopelta aegis]